MACTVVDIWSLWITLRDVTSLLLWETSAAWGNYTLQLGLQQDEMEFLYVSKLRIMQISVLILIHPYKRREWCFKSAFDIYFSLFLLRSTVKLPLSSTDKVKCRLWFFWGLSLYAHVPKRTHEFISQFKRYSRRYFFQEALQDIIITYLYIKEQKALIPMLVWRLLTSSRELLHFLK